MAGLGLLLGALCVATLPTPLAAQLAGRVIEIETGQALDAARIVLMAADGDTVATTSTRGDGRFGIFGEPEEGEYFITASIIGFRPVATRFEYAGDPLAFDMRMSTAPLRLEGVSVEVEQRHRLEVGGFYDRARRGFGDHLAFTDPSSRRGASRASHLVRRIAGVAVSESGEPYFRGSGSCLPVLVIDRMIVRDGTRPSSLSNDFDLVMPPPEDILGLEVYRSNETTPPQWRRQGMCGAIVAWTR